MKQIAIKALHEESFIECPIISCNLDLINKKLIVETNGAEVMDGFLSKARIIVKDWKKIKVVERTAENIRTLENFPKFLTSIMFLSFKDNILKLTGLGFDCWRDWIFEGATFEVYGEYK